MLWWGTYKCPYSKWWITCINVPGHDKTVFSNVCERADIYRLLYCAVTVKGASSRGVPLANMAMQGRRSSANLSAADQSERSQSKDMTHTRDSIDANNPHVYCSNYSSVLLCNWLNSVKNSEEKTQITSIQGKARVKRQCKKKHSFLKTFYTRLISWLN